MFSGTAALAASENPADEMLERLRAGELSKAEVDALIEEGLTVADLQDPYAVSLLAISNDENDRVDPAWFNFVVNKPDETRTFPDYAALQAEYGLSGTWEGPRSKEQTDENGNYYQDYNDDHTYAGLYYPHLDDQENDIEYQVKRVSYHDTAVYHIGNVVINTTEGEQHYTYVSSERTTGAASHFILPADAKITVEYGPREYQVFYQVVVDGVSSATSDETFGSHAIFGDARPTTTTEQAVSATVTIPAGYYARVYIGDFADNRDEELFPGDYITYAQSLEDGNHVENTPGMTTAYEKFPLEKGYGNYPLGMGPNFIKDPTTEKDVDGESNVAEAIILDTTADRETPGFFSLTATYTSGEKGSADADQLIRVVLAKRTEFTVSNGLWGATQTGEFIQQNKIKGNLLGGERKIFTTKDANGNYILDTSKYGGDSGYVEPTGVTINEDGSYNFTWTFTTKTHKSWLYELRTLSINGENLEVPFISNPSAEVVASETRRSAETEEQQISGATVQVRVTAVDTTTEEYAADGGTNFYGDRYQRKYEIIFTNVTRNIIVTTSALALQKNDEFIASTLTGVDLQLWSGEKSTNFNWGKAEQGQSFHVAQNFNWNENSYGTYNGGKYNARFKIQNGYELKTPAPDDDRERADVLASVTYATKLGEEQAVAGVAGPDESGWYYLNLPNTAGSTTYVLFIEADLMQYRVNYLDGVTTGANLQRGVHGLPDGDAITGMPDFSAWNHGGSPTVDNNAGNYYNLIANNTIRIDASTPTDTPADPADRTATFLYWVLTDANGTPVNHDKEAIVDKSQYFTVKGDELRQLADVASAAYKDDDGIYTFYLTAYWEPPAEPFTYYVTFNRLNENGEQAKDAYHPKNLYPMVDANNDPIGGVGAPLRYAAQGRYTYAKVSSSTVVFDPDSTLVADYKATAPWDKLDSATNGDYLYHVVNFGEIPVWFVYTLGGLTIENKTAVDGRLPAPTFTYTVTFTLPADDADTGGNEAAFFGANNYSIGSTKGAVSLTSKGGRTYEGTVTLAANESVTFNDLPAGTTYTVRQTNASAGYFESAEAQCTTTARPTDNNQPAAKNVGVIAARYSDVMTFNNKANAVIPTAGKLAVTVNKTVDCVSAPPDETFTFTLAADAGNPTGGATLPTNTQASVAYRSAVSANTGTFGNITFNLPGTYTFTVTETAGTTPGYTYDTTPKTITVTADEVKGALKITAVTVDGKAVTAGNTVSLDFTNTYTVTPTSYAPQVTKTVVTSDNAPEETFTFTIQANANDPAGATLPDDTEIEIAYPADVSAGFGGITFAAAGTYHFTIKEVPGDAAGYHYDNTEWTLTVAVKDESSKLKVDNVSYSNGATNNESAATFTNEYYALSARSDEVVVNKVLNGRALEAGEFEFVISTDATEGIRMPHAQTVKNDATGKVNFGAITFTAPGAYTVTIKEVIPAGAANNTKDGIKYDTHKVEITYQVDEVEGQLQVEGSTSGNTTFTNKFETSGGSKPGSSGSSGSGDISGSGGNGDNNTSSTVPAANLNTTDHYAYIIGFVDGTVRPEAYISRGEVVTIFFRLLTDDARGKYWATTNPYPDVDEDSWCNNAISTMTNMGVVSGYLDGTFRPNDPISRAELTKIAVSFFHYAATGDVHFTDLSDDHWAYSFIQAANELGLVLGYPDGSFHPNDNITRSETVAIVNRVLGRKPHKDGMPDGMIQWSDSLDKDTWYYADMQEATNSHEYEMDRKVGGATYETWTKLLPVRDWAALEKQWSNAHSALGGEVMDKAD